MAWWSLTISLSIPLRTLSRVPHFSEYLIAHSVIHRAQYYPLDQVPIWKAGHIRAMEKVGGIPSAESHVRVTGKLRIEMGAWAPPKLTTERCSWSWAWRNTGDLVTRSRKASYLAGPRGTQHTRQLLVLPLKAERTEGTPGLSHSLLQGQITNSHWLHLPWSSRIGNLKCEVHWGVELGKKPLEGAENTRLLAGMEDDFGEITHSCRVLVSLWGIWDHHLLGLFWDLHVMEYKSVFRNLPNRVYKWEGFYVGLQLNTCGLESLRKAVGWCLGVTRNFVMPARYLTKGIVLWYLDLSLKKRQTMSPVLVRDLLGVSSPNDK